MSETTFVSGITSAATSHILDTLSTLYANPPYAVLREFIANGIDAHADAGHSGPVKVVLPTRNDPIIVISDQGKGMSRDTLVNTYYNYGESTKRQDDSRIGAFGLGAKSAFAVSPTWSLVSVTATHTYHVSSSINGDGIPEHKIVEETHDGSEPTGVTVTIPVHDARTSFNNEAERLRFWLPKGSVEMIGGHLRDAHWTNGATVHGALAFLRSSNREAGVLMGGVPYRADLHEARSRAVVALSPLAAPSFMTPFGEIDRSVVEEAFHGSDAVVVLDDPKALDVTTSRDDIKTTRRTLDVLESVLSVELRSVMEILTSADGSVASLESHIRNPLVGTILRKQFSRRDDRVKPTDLIRYSSRKNTYSRTVSRIHLLQNVLWDRYPRPKLLVVTHYPSTLPALPMVERVAGKRYGAVADHIFLTHTDSTGDAMLDSGRDALSRHGVTFVTWDEYREAVREERARDRADRGAPEIPPVEGVVIRDHKAVSRFSVKLAKFSNILEQNEGVPIYFIGIWHSDTDQILSKVPRGFTGILVKSLADARRDNLLATRHGVLPSSALSALSVTASTVDAIRALTPKLRRAVLDYLDIESSGSGTDFAAVMSLYAYHEDNGKPLAGTAFIKALESCHLGRTVVGSRDSGFRRYGMDSAAILREMRRDEDRFYTRYPLLTVLNMGRTTAAPGAMDAVVQYIKSVEIA